MAEPAQLEDEQLRALDRLKPASDRLGLYLAGGTAIAFHLGHRVSRDLDLFSVAPDLDLGRVQESVLALADVDVVSLTDVMFRFRLASVPIDIVRYRYPLLHPASGGPHGFATASLEDLATMKLAAVVRRGIRRDFWDLDEIFSRGGVTLSHALACYVRRFGVQESDLYHVLRALSYFDDADRETILPAGLTPERWSAIKESLSSMAGEVLKARLQP